MGGSGVTAVEDLADRLRDDIVAGAIGLGSRLTLEHLARRYASGHMPAREALRQLAGEGLVVIEPNRGASVRSVDLDFVHELFDLRVAIEGLLARRCAERIDATQLARIEAAQAAYEALAERRDYAGLLAANRDFHRAMNDAARNLEATAIVDRHWRLIAALWHRFGYGQERVAGVIADHRQILQALHDRDADAAESLARAHASKAKQALIRRMRAAAGGAAA